MTVQKLQMTDGFVVRDFPDVPASGVVRRGRKILQRSATDLARSATYAFASFEIERSGASAGVNAEGDDEGPALAAMLNELAGELDSGRLELLAGKGVAAAELAARPENRIEQQQQAAVAGILASCRWALGGDLDGRRLFIEGSDSSDPELALLVAEASARGVTLVVPNHPEDKPWLAWGTECDALVVGSRPGAMTHQGAELVKATAVVPRAPLPITTKALAVLLQRNIVYVPDFVAASGALVAHHLPGHGAVDTPGTEAYTERLGELLAELGADDEPLFLAASHRAESHLRSWRSELPFGRPLAG